MTTWITRVQEGRGLYREVQLIQDNAHDHGFLMSVGISAIFNWARIIILFPDGSGWEEGLL